MTRQTRTKVYLAALALGSVLTVSEAQKSKLLRDFGVIALGGGVGGLVTQGIQRNLLRKDKEK